MRQIKAIFILFVLFLSAAVSRADLLGRIKIEEILKERLEHALKIQDPSAQVTIRIEYNKYLSIEDLPGTNQTANKMYYAEKVENSDINRVFVQYFSEDKEMKVDQSNLIYSLIPLDKPRVSVSFKQLPASAPKPVPIEAKDINDIADKSIHLLSVMLGSALAAAFLIFGFALLFNNSKNRTLFKQQFGGLISALSNGSFGVGSKAATNEDYSKKPGVNFTSASGSNYKTFEDYSPDALVALFSDLYWCEKDETSFYVWNNMTTQQKSEVLHQLDFMHDYSVYFASQDEQAETEPMSLLMHPYYNRPLALNKTSQEALLPLVKKNFGLWHKLSPIRQQALSLSLKEKIKANGAANMSVVTESFPVSKPRVLPRHVNFGDISFEDELEIFKDEKIIPSDLKVHVPSLVWLAFKDVDFIKSKLEKLDAKFLASAWIAAPEVLEKLEQSLPEKKLQLLKSYLKSVQPSKSSSAFQALFELGLEVSNQDHEPIQKAS